MNLQAIEHLIRRYNYGYRVKYNDNHEPIELSFTHKFNEVLFNFFANNKSFISFNLHVNKKTTHYQIRFDLFKEIILCLNDKKKAIELTELLKGELKRK